VQFFRTQATQFVALHAPEMRVALAFRC